MRRRFLYAQTLALVLVALWFHAGLTFGFFYSVPWYDIPAHILGGMWAAFFCAWLSLLFNRRLAFFHMALGALLIGGVWELFEYALHIGGSVFMSYPVDTAKDLLDDVLGGVLAALLARRL